MRGYIPDKEVNGHGKSSWEEVCVQEMWCRVYCHSRRYWDIALLRAADGIEEVDPLRMEAEVKAKERKILFQTLRRYGKNVFCHLSPKGRIDFPAYRQAGKALECPHSSYGKHSTE
jgi:hypothetical protein